MPPENSHAKKFCRFLVTYQYVWSVVTTSSKLYTVSQKKTASSLKGEQLIKKQTYMKTETCKLYSRVFYQNRSLQFWAIPSQSLHVFWDTVYICGRERPRKGREKGEEGKGKENEGEKKQRGREERDKYWLKNCPLPTTNPGYAPANKFS